MQKCPLFPFIFTFTFSVSYLQYVKKECRIKMKKLIKQFVSLILVVFCIAGSTLGASAESSCSWYIKRNGNKRPTFPKEAEFVSEHGGYYIDERCSYSDERKVIYLTFDAGYENGNIESILDTLKAENVPAAFFLLDNIILKNTDLVRRMADEGHLVCNHTKNHKDLSCAGEEEIAKNLTALEKIYEEKTGYEMAKYFRFPEGKYSKSALMAVEKLGYKTVFWSFGYDDWDNVRQPNEKKAIKKILDNTHNGAIFLFHPTSETNAKIFPELIRAWRDMGYSFGTLDELTAN